MGLDGLDGPNKVCMNRHEVPTGKSYCWLANAVILKVPPSIRFQTNEWRNGLSTRILVWIFTSPKSRTEGDKFRIFL